MKIGIYDPYLDDLGGGEKYMMTLAECLSRNHEVDLFWDDEEDLKILGTRFSINLSKIKRVENIFSSKFSTLQRFKKTKDYDAIVVLSDGSIPLVSSRLYLHIQQPLESMQTISLKDRLKLKRVNLFFCNSEYTKSFITERFHLKTVILYPPVTLKPKNIQKENIILHVGRFRVRNVKADDYKKQSVMLDSFKEMVKSGLKDWKFVLAVSVQEKDEKDFEFMKSKAQGLPVEFLVNKSNDELWDIYSRSKIYWHASGYGEDLESHPELAEHFGISTVEAMGAGVVPVVINAGGQKEIVIDGENGFLWDSLDVLKSQTLNLIDKPELLEKLASKARERAEIFTAEKFDKKVNEIIV